jgi:transposase
VRGRRSPIVICLTTEQREELAYFVRCPNKPAGLVRRARAVLILAQGGTFCDIQQQTGLQRRHARKWATRFVFRGIDGLNDAPRPGRKPVFSPVRLSSRPKPSVAIQLVKVACERPDLVGRSLSQWDCPELGRQLVRDGVVARISAQTVRRILQTHQLKPWRQHLWLGSTELAEVSPKVPRDAAFAASVQNVCDLYTRELLPFEMVLSVDEKTSLQPRTRLSPTLPAKPGLPVRVEHEYQRKGALNLFAAFDTRTGKVYGRTAERKRQVEFIAFLEQLDRELPPQKTTVHVVLDNLRMHNGKQVMAWLADHPRFVFHHPPVHCSWMNQIEQWFSILQRKRLAIADFADKKELAERLDAFIREWNENAHPFNWSTKSVAKVMAKCKIAA